MNLPYFCIEKRDDAALRELQRVKPEAVEVMIEQCRSCPHYDGKECISSLELFFGGTGPGYALFFYIEGNRDEKDNGWILRYFPGVYYNSEAHIAIRRAVEMCCGGRMEPVDTL